MMLLVGTEPFDSISSKFIMRRIRVLLAFSVLSLSLIVGCTKDSFTERITHAIVRFENKQGLMEEGYMSDIPDCLGVHNALKKAAQMRDVKWVANGDGMPFNNGSFAANTTYSGIPYSSVLEYNQHVFLDVSLETFITAAHNTRSVLYTENVSGMDSRSSLGREYHGSNCACYYGSTCSYLIVYALGLPFGIAASEFPFWNEMEVVNDQSASGVNLADVLSSSGHVALVTDIKRDITGTIHSITITENAFVTTSSNVFSPTEFNEYLKTGYTILRYKNIKNNTTYIPLTDFVAVEGETTGDYMFNDDICPNYGNKSNYAEGDMVVLNVCVDYKAKGYTHLFVYKDNELLSRQSINDIDIVLTDLPYGDYKVCLTDREGGKSDYAYFKVVNMSVIIDSSAANDIVYFSSANSTPIYYDFCREDGGKGPAGVNGLLSHLLTPEEIAEGKAELTSPLVLTESHPYIKVHFETEYGRTVKSIKKN